MTYIQVIYIYYTSIPIIISILIKHNDLYQKGHRIPYHKKFELHILYHMLTYTYIFKEIYIYFNYIYIKICLYVHIYIYIFELYMY